MKHTLKLLLLPIIWFAFSAESCEERATQVSSSGISNKTVQVQTDQSGWTIEQKNIATRLKMDNTPGSIKHLYVISPYSGEVILYSTVQGKVTSSGKRLAPTTISTNNPATTATDGIPIKLGGYNYRTGEVLEDDGTYGHSVEYIYWWDAQGRYHQHFFTGGQILHVSDQPLPIHKVMINVSGDNQ